METAIRERAFIIHADMKFGIKPASNNAGARWLRQAWAWAICHNRKSLVKLIEGYLSEDAENVLGKA